MKKKWESDKLPLYELHNLKKRVLGNSLAVQWTGLCVSTAGGTGSIHSLGTKIHMPRGTAKKNKTKHCPHSLKGSNQNASVEWKTGLLTQLPNKI